ncbi:AAA family ATPase [Gryllotalpicola kribbensis]|uniref:AAA family ATPase n=1 Tax=Gryllotalpicola kribbensis TaxID=993084 RepID=A0ABP8AYI1_9MICO
MSLSEFDRDVLRAFQAFMERAVGQVDEAGSRTPFGDRLAAHLGTAPERLPVVAEAIAEHRLVDADVALRELSGGDPDRLIGVSGGSMRMHSGLPELVAHTHARFDVGPVDFVAAASGPSATTQVVSFGAWLLEFDGTPVVVLQRAAAHEFGRQAATLEVLAPSPEVAAALLDRVRTLMVELSVLRGKVLSFHATEYGNAAGATFLERPRVAADDVVLPPGVMEMIDGHVVGIAAYREQLRAAGQHLKRGVLLYGPPGTGKTLTVRRILSATEGVTAVVLTGESIQFIGAATEIARTFQPSLVVLEDIDLVAMQRHMTPQPLLFEVLDALDGLDGDADVAFIMTTNRVSVLEKALAQRPGRVDLAVEIPLPDVAARKELFRRYAQRLDLPDEALDDAAARAEGVTGSFAKELMRRTALAAARESVPATADHLKRALDDLLSASAELTRAMLGTPRAPEQSVDDEPDDMGQRFVAFGPGARAFMTTASFELAPDEEE